MNIVVDDSGKVLMWSENGRPTPPDGARLLEIGDGEAKAFLSTPNTRGIAFDGKTFTALPALPPPPEPTVDQKLARIGLTVAELAQALSKATEALR